MIIIMSGDHKRCLMVLLGNNDHNEIVSVYNVHMVEMDDSDFLKI